VQRTGSTPAPPAAPPAPETGGIQPATSPGFGEASDDSQTFRGDGAHQEGTGRPATEGPRPASTSAVFEGKALIAELIRQTGPVSAYRGADIPAGSSSAGTLTASGEVPQQVIRAIRLQWHQGVGEARLRLHPQHLGEVTITLKVEAGHVAASLRTETAAAQQWIEAHQQDLRAALKEQGLTFTGFVVRRDRDEQSDGRQSEREGDAEPRRRPRPLAGEEEPRFEVVV
jgi:flagellar hook-length control protein FliK